jgi:hypothetical protein
MPDLTADIEHVSADIVVRLQNAGIIFCFTGGLVSSFYGEMRFTQDIDIVLQIQASDVSNLIAALETNYIVDREMLEEAAQTQGMAQLLHEETFIRIDLHIGEKIPHAFDRLQTVELFPNVFVPISSKEDAILSKLRWVQLGSQKSRRDIVMMLRNTTPTDRGYVDKIAQQMGLEDIWTEMQQLAEGD